ncbi:MAG: hypothetical protein R3D71_08720 [Rickettsiales bacterium]
MDKQVTEGGNSTDRFGELFSDEYAVMLLQGKNSFGDMIYSYVEVTMPNIKKLYAALHSGKDFAPSDYGKIIASGKGKPSEELSKEMDANYNMLTTESPSDDSISFKPVSEIDLSKMKKKAWDEY